MQLLSVGTPVNIIGDTHHYGKPGVIDQYFSLPSGIVMARVLLDDGYFIEVLPQHLFQKPLPPPGPPPPLPPPPEPQQYQPPPLPPPPEPQQYQPPPSRVWPGPPPSSAQEMAALKPYLEGNSNSYKTLNRFRNSGGNKNKTRRRQRQNKRNRKNKYSHRRRNAKSISK